MNRTAQAALDAMQGDRAQRPDYSGALFPSTCIRCGARHDNKKHAYDAGAIPWEWRYCTPCATVRCAERAAADIVQGPITEVRE